MPAIIATRWAADDQRSSVCSVQRMQSVNQSL